MRPVSTAKQGLGQQIDALGRNRGRSHLCEQEAGSTVDRPGLRAVMEFARDCDVIVVHTLDRLGRTVRDT